MRKKEKKFKNRNKIVVVKSKEKIMDEEIEKIEEKLQNSEVLTTEEINKLWENKLDGQI